MSDHFGSRVAFLRDTEKLQILHVLFFVILLPAFAFSKIKILDRYSLFQATDRNNPQNYCAPLVHGNIFVYVLIHLLFQIIFHPLLINIFKFLFVYFIIFLNKLFHVLPELSIFVMICCHWTDFTFFAQFFFNFQTNHRKKPNVVFERISIHDWL